MHISGRIRQRFCSNSLGCTKAKRSKKPLERSRYTSHGSTCNKRHKKKLRLCPCKHYTPHSAHFRSEYWEIGINISVTITCDKGQATVAAIFASLESTIFCHPIHGELPALSHYTAILVVLGKAACHLHWHFTTRQVPGTPVPTIQSYGIP